MTKCDKTQLKTLQFIVSTNFIILTGDIVLEKFKFEMNNQPNHTHSLLALSCTTQHLNCLLSTLFKIILLFLIDVQNY